MKYGIGRRGADYGSKEDAYKSAKKDLKKQVEQFTKFLEKEKYFKKKKDKSDKPKDPKTEDDDE